MLTRIGLLALGKYMDLKQVESSPARRTFPN